MHHVLITGGSRGIGAALVRAFTAQGDAVAFLYRADTQSAQKITEETGAYAIRADVCDPAAIRAALE